MWQPRDQVDVDVRDPAGSQVVNVIEHGCTIVQTPDRGRFLIDKRLHTQTHAIHTAALQGLNHSRSQRARSTFDRKLRVWLNLEILRNRDKQPSQLAYIEYSRSSAAQVDGVDDPVGANTHLCYSRVVTFHVSAYAVHIALEDGAGKDVRSKIAIAALSTAERYGDVQAKRHVNDYPTLAVRLRPAFERRF